MNSLWSDRRIDAGSIFPRSSLSAFGDRWKFEPLAFFAKTNCMNPWLDYARLLRLPNVFTAMADICLGALVTGALPTQTIRFVLLLLASSCLYLAGMVWNDFFDIEQDRRERPHRPLASGRIARATAGWLGAGLMAGGLLFAWSADWHTLRVAVPLAVAVLLYDGWLKRTPLGPVAMGTCRFLNVLLGLSVLPGPTIPAWGWMLALAVGVYIAGVTWFARTEASESSVQTLRGAAGVMLAGVALALTVPALYRDAMPGEPINPAFPYFLIGFIFFVGMPVFRAIARPLPERVQAAVKRAVLGLVIFDAILATALAGWIGMVVALPLLPAAWLGRWVYST